MRLKRLFVPFVFALVATRFTSQVLAQITVDGDVRWTDRRGPNEPASMHPARLVLVEICDGRLPVANQVIVTTVTGDEGHYSATLPAQSPARDIFIRARSESPAASIQAIGTNLTYILGSQPRPGLNNGASVHINLNGDVNSTNNAAFSVLDSFLDERRYVSNLTQKDLQRIDVEFPTADESSNFSKGKLHILLGDKWDWDVMMHEYGHYISSVLSLDKNPGGYHAFNENLGERLSKDVAVRLAWGEGWPTYFAVQTQHEMNMSKLGIPSVGDSHYSDSEDAAIDLDLSSDGEGSLGEDNEVSVMRVLYDLSILHPDKLTANQIWNRLVGAKPANLSEAILSLSNSAPMDEQAFMGSIETKHHVSPSVTNFMLGSALPDDPITLRWTANGGGNSHPNDHFMVRFYDSTMKLILETPTIDSASFTPSDIDWSILKQKNASFFMVAGYNFASPQTGPYFSSLQKIIDITLAQTIR